MVFPTRANRFNFIINEKLLKHGESIIVPIYATVLPTLTDYWLVGITDAEGSFTRLSNSSSAYRFRYILNEANRYVLQHIVNLFNKCLWCSIKPFCWKSIRN